MGVFPFIVLVVAPAMLFVGAGVAILLLLRSRLRVAREMGYPSLAAYLRAAPRTDEERRDAADLALKGLVLCLLGLLFAPLVLFGLVPFFYGARKVVYASLGLGLTDEPDQPGR